MQNLSAIERVNKHWKYLTHVPEWMTIIKNRHTENFLISFVIQLFIHKKKLLCRCENMNVNFIVVKMKFMGQAPANKTAASKLNLSNDILISLLLLLYTAFANFLASNFISDTHTTIAQIIDDVLCPMTRIYDKSHCRV